MIAHHVEAVQGYRPIEQLIPARWRQEFIDANGIRQHLYRTGGDKPPLILFHGFMEYGLSWLRLAGTMADRFDVIMPDARVHGRSHGSQTPVTPALMAEDALALIEALDLQQPILFGRSNGAVTAVLVAAARPTLARAVLLEEPPLGASPPPGVRTEATGAGNWFAAWLQWLRSLQQRPHAERIAATAERWPHGTPVLPDEPVWPEEEFVPWVEGLAQFDTSVFDGRISFWSLAPYMEQVAQIPCPILLLAGNPDYGSVVPVQAGEELAAVWQQGEMVRFENAGHLVIRGRTFVPSLAAVEAFLNKIS